uniref:Uncharacterized protein n=1 Tax=Anopheles arabiensis TaxID=7173 RepID=A0A182HGW4_ANOAR
MESAAIDVQELENAASIDEVLGKVKNSLRSGCWNEIELKQYIPFKEELGMIGEMVIRGNKLVVPDTLRKRMLDLAHEGHPGESVMKRRLRNRVWWPGMDKEIEQHVKNCEGCRLVETPGKPEPMMRRPLPLRPWMGKERREDRPSQKET